MATSINSPLKFKMKSSIRLLNPRLTTIKTDNDKPDKSIVTTKTELEKMKAVIMRGKSKNLSRAEIEKAVRKVIGVKGLDEDKKEKHIKNVLELMMQSISSQMVKYQKI